MNQRVLAREGAGAERLGSIDRVTAERHGAIRVGPPRELAQVARVFGALGMSPCGFYDLRDAAPAPVPVVSTAFRPLDRDELAANPFRVFTSMLVPEDRRFFDADLEGRLRSFLDAPRALPRRAARPGRRRRRARGALGDRRGPLPGPGRRVVRAVHRSGRPRLVHRARAGLRGRRRHRRRDLDAHQPPHPAGARHRRPVRLDAGAGDRDDRRDPGPAAVGRPGRAAAADLVPRAGRATHLPGRRRELSTEGRCGSGSARSRPAASRSPRQAGTASTSSSPPSTVGWPRTRTCVAPTWHQRCGATGLPATERDLCLDGLGFFTFRVDAAPSPGVRRRSSRPHWSGGPRRPRPVRRPAARADRLRGLPAPLGGRHLRLEPHRRRDHGRGPGWRRA